MQARRDASLLSTLLIAIGAILIVAGVVLFATAPVVPAELREDIPMPGSEGYLEGKVSFDEVSRRSDEWFEESSRRSRAEFDADSARMTRLFVAGVCGMFGIALVVGGVGMTRRARQLAVELRSDQAHAMALGIRRGLDSDGESVAERLQRLKDLHDQGLITADELAAKRREILAAV